MNEMEREGAAKRNKKRKGESVTSTQAYGLQVLLHIQSDAGR